MGSRSSLALGLALAVFVLAAPAEARRGSAGSSLKPFIGFSAFLDVDVPVPISGNKFLFGANYTLEMSNNLEWTFGMHLGAGGASILLRPVVELHYRFDLDSDLVPWVGGGVSLRLASPANHELNFGVTGRLNGGVDYFIADWFALSATITLPDLGIRIAPSVVTIGTIEIDFGPRFQF